MSSTQYAHHPCAHCTNPATKACLKCHQSFYCSRACQTTHHRVHKRTCAALAQVQAVVAQQEQQQQQQSSHDNAEEDAAAAAAAAAAARARMMGPGGFVREFATREELWRWVREVNELGEGELGEERGRRRRRGEGGKGGKGGKEVRW